MWVWLHVDMTSWWEGTALTSHKYLPSSWNSVHNPRHSLIVPLTKWTLLSKKKKMDQEGPVGTKLWKISNCSSSIWIGHCNRSKLKILISVLYSCTLLSHNNYISRIQIISNGFRIRYKLSHQSLPIQIPPYFTLKHPPTFTYAPLNERHHSFSSQILILPLYHI